MSPHFKLCGCLCRAAEKPPSRILPSELQPRPSIYAQSVQTSQQPLIQSQHTIVHTYRHTRRTFPKHTILVLEKMSS